MSFPVPAKLPSLHRGPRLALSSSLFRALLQSRLLPPPTRMGPL